MSDANDQAAPGPLPGGPQAPRVRHRDGKVSDWEGARIESAVARAQSAVRDRDPVLARDVAQVVALTASSRARSEGGQVGIVDLEDVQDWVERALIELGRASVAKAYILYRDRRARRRSALEMQSAEASESQPLIEIVGANRVQPFDRGRLAASLVDHGDLPLELAEQAVLRIERRLIDGDLRRIEPALLASLRDHEIVALGFAPNQEREPIAVERGEVLALAAEAGESRRPLDLRAATRDAASRAGARVFDAWVAGALSQGPSGATDQEYLFIETLGPGRSLVRCLPTDLVRPSRPTSCMELLSGVGVELARSGGGLVLEQLGDSLVSLLRSTRRASRAPVVRDLLRGLGALASATGKRLDLSRPGGTADRGPEGPAASLLRETAQLVQAGEDVPRLFWTWDELAGALFDDPALRDSANDLVQRGHLVPVWGAESERWAGPGCRRRVDEEGILALEGVAALNLPRLARRAGPWREEHFFEELVTLVERAVEALCRLEQALPGRPMGGEALAERRVFALTPIGLAEALVILGDGFASAETGALLVGVLDEAARRLADARGLAACLTPFASPRAADHFARLDGRARALSQPRLFAELPRPEEGSGQPYSAGFDLRPASTLGGEPGGVLEAGLLGTLPSGCLAPFAMLEGAPVDPEDRHPALTAWERFDRLRRPSTRDAAVRPLPSLPPGDAGPLFRAAFGSSE